MKSNEATIFIFIASVIIGILISSNMNFGKVNNKVLLTPSEYQEAYNYSNKLSKDIKNIKSKYDDYSKKLQEYKNNKNNKNEMSAKIEQEIEYNEIIIGNVDLEGEGVIIKLDDAPEEIRDQVTDPNELAVMMVHDRDLYRLINELKFAGAEAISLNGIRITNTSGIKCWGVFTRIDGIKIPSPFNIKVIGDKEKIYSYMSRDSGYLSTLKFRQVQVEINKYHKVRIMAKDKKVSYEHMKEIKLKDEK